MMKNHPFFLFLFAPLMFMLTFGGEIVLWNGKIIPNVELLGIQAGKIKIRYKGAVRTIEALKIKAYNPCSDSQFKIRYFGRHKLKKDEGILLSLQITNENPRIPQPFVRIFVCQKLASGKRVVSLYRNFRLYDPTSVWPLPVVDLDAIQTLSYFIKTSSSTTQILAAYCEIWFEGKVVQKKEIRFGNEELEEAWFQKIKPSATRTMSPLKEEEEEEAEKSVKEIETIPAKVQIKSASVKPPPREKTPVVRLSYTLYSRLPHVPIPKSVMYYVLRNSEGNIEIKTTNLDSNAGREVTLLHDEYKYTLEKKMETGIVSSLLDMSRSKLKNPKQLVHWRIEIFYGDHRVAYYEPQTSFRKELPDRWWE
ncbi:MAG: hypothetical protein D6820_04630 [Lentisphaerae bacterium]|nr:MAG: hypothetical protein D6820_04630 [Lentisphaerota bacterium]